MSAQRREARRARADARALAAAQVTMTAHAASRARELGFTCQDIARCTSDPDESYGCHRSYGEHRRTYQRDDVAVVLDECTREVVTVLLRRQDRWRHGVDVRQRQVSA